MSFLSVQLHIVIRLRIFRVEVTLCLCHTVWIIFYDKSSTSKLKQSLHYGRYSLRIQSHMVLFDETDSHQERIKSRLCLRK